MKHIEKWCDVLNLGDGLESWNDNSFGIDYRYTVNRIDMIPDALTDYTILDINNPDDDKNLNIKQIGLVFKNQEL